MNRYDPNFPIAESRQQMTGTVLGNWPNGLLRPLPANNFLKS